MSCLCVSFLICETMMTVSVKCLARCLAQLVLNKRYVLFKSILLAGKQTMDVDRNRDANQGRKSVILSFPFFTATISNIFVPLRRGCRHVCQVPRQAEILLKEEHNRLGDCFSPILGSALMPLVLRSVSKKLSSQLFCSSRLSILHSECFYANHPILDWSYNKYWKNYNLGPSNSESSGRHH